MPTSKVYFEIWPWTVGNRSEFVTSFMASSAATTLSLLAVPGRIFIQGKSNMCIVCGKPLISIRVCRERYITRKSQRAPATKKIFEWSPYCCSTPRMMTFGRLGAFFFFFLSIHLAGVAARPSSNQARSGLLSSQDSELRTNAKRLAAGLTPLKPRQFYKPSRVGMSTYSFHRGNFVRFSLIV